MSNDTTTVKPGGSAEFKLTPKTDLDNSVEVFNAADLQTKAGALETAFSEFAQILGEVNTYVNAEVNTSHDKCVFSPGYGTQLLKLWNDNASTFGDFHANFESWSQAIAIIANKNSQTEVDIRAIYGDRGDTITAFDENGITNESIAAMRERINLEDTALNDFGGNSYTYYDENGNLISVQKDANGNIVGQIIRDANGNIISETYTDSDGNYAVIIYDENGNPVVTYYDKDGNVLTTKPDSFNTDGTLTEAEKKELGVPENPTQEEIDELGYDPSKWDENGINRETGTPYDSEGYDVNGYDKEGYNKDGFNKDGIHKETGDEFGPDGYNKDGYDENGFDRDGYDKDGLDKDGNPRPEADGGLEDGQEAGTEGGAEEGTEGGSEGDTEGGSEGDTESGTEGGSEGDTEGGSEGDTEGGSETETEGETTAETAGYAGYGSDKGKIPEDATVTEVDSFGGEEGVKAVSWQKDNGEYVTVLFDKDGNEVSAVVSDEPFDPNNPNYDSVKEWSDGEGNEYDKGDYEAILSDDPESLGGDGSTGTGDMDDDGIPDSEDIYYDDDVTVQPTSVTVHSGQKVTIDGKDYYYLMSKKDGSMYYTLSNDPNAQVYVDNGNGPEIYTDYNDNAVTREDFVDDYKHRVDVGWSATYNNGSSPFDSVDSSGAASYEGVSSNTSNQTFIYNDYQSIQDSAVPLSSINFGEVSLGRQELPEVIYVAPGDNIRWDPTDFLDLKDIHIEGGSEGKYLVLDPTTNTYYAADSSGSVFADGGDDSDWNAISVDRLLSEDTEIDTK